MGKYVISDIHGYYDKQEEDFCLWDRSIIAKDNSFKDYKIICGHTIVQNIDRYNKDIKIIHQNKNIFIDCGCGYSDIDSKLACLRLDDMKEFYI